MRNRAKETTKTASTLSANKIAPGHVTAGFPPDLIQPTFRQTALLCLFLFAVALCINLYHIGDPSLWFDETLSVTRAWQPLPVLFQIVSVTQPNMALYYFVLHFWLDFTGLFGIHATEAVVRLPSALLAACGSLLFYSLARRFFGLRIGCLAALLYLLNTQQLTYAQETRAYALQIFLLSLSWYALLMLISSDLTRRRALAWWLCFILSSTLAVYAQLFTELMLATQALAMALLCIIPTIWRARVRQRIGQLLLSWLCLGILLLPILYASRVGSKTGWLPVPRPDDVYHLFLTICGQSHYLLAFFTVIIGLGLFVTLLSARRGGQEQLRQLRLVPTEEIAAGQWQQRFVQLLPLAILLLCWLICPVAISYLVSQKATRLFSPRYLVVIVPAFVLLIALGLSVLRWRALQMLLGLGLLLLSLRTLPNYYLNAQVEDWRTGTQWIQQYFQPGDGLICYDNSEGCAVDIEYYLQTYPHGPAHFDADSPGYFSWVNYDATNQLGNYRLALDINAIQLYGTQHPRIFFGIGRADSNDPQVQPTIRWLNAHYHLLVTEVTSTLTIYLYDTTT
jgi:uncharacterized membrane protein